MLAGHLESGPQVHHLLGSEGDNGTTQALPHKLVQHVRQRGQFIDGQPREFVYKKDQLIRAGFIGSHRKAAHNA